MGIKVWNDRHLRDAVIATSLSISVAASAAIFARPESVSRKMASVAEA